MYHVSIRDLNTFSRFLNIADVDFVDFYFSTKGTVLIIMNNSEVFAAFNAECETGLMDKAVSFRMRRQILRDLATEGSIVFHLDDNTVHAEFYNTVDDLVWSVKFQYQTAVSVLYERKSELLQKKTKALDVVFDNLGALPKICSNSGKALTVASGICSVVISPGVSVYRKISSKCMFSITAKNLSVLQKCDTGMFAVENYVGAANPSFAVLVARSRQNEDSVYEYAAGSKSVYRSQYEAEVDLGKLLRFYRTCKIKDKPAVINLENKLCNTVIGGIEYSIPVNFSSERKAAKCSFNEIIIPYSVINGVLQHMKSAKYKLCRKKNFCQLWQNDYVVLFN